MNRKLLAVNLLINKEAINRFQSALEKYSRATFNSKILSELEWNRIWSSYVIDLMMSDYYSDNFYVSNIDRELIKNISTLSNIKESTIEMLLQDARSNAEITVKQSNITFEDLGDKLLINNLVLDNPTLTKNYDQLMRYELIKGFDETKDFTLDPSIWNKAIHLCVNTLYFPGELNEEPKGVGMFRDDENSLGNPITFLSELREQKDMIIHGVSSRRFSSVLLSLLDKYTAKYPKAEIYFFTRLEDLKSSKLVYSKYPNINVFVSNKRLLENVKNQIKEVPFPFSRSFMPSFEEMFNNLESIANNLDTYMNWSAKKLGCNLGVVERRFPEDYYSTDSIADISAEEMRIHCYEENNKSPYDIWQKIVFDNPSVLNLSVKEQREEIYNNKGRGCNLFNAALGTYLISRFLGKGCKVLDPTSGYGERAIASWACQCSEYRGWDTNPVLQKAYSEQKKMYEELKRKSVNSEIKYGAFEDDIALFDGIYKGYFNGALLSPPFFTQEIYPGELTSTERYKEFSLWSNNFYLPMLEACYKGTIEGGFIMLYIPSPIITSRAKGGKKSYLSEMEPIARKKLSSLGGINEGSQGLVVYSSSSIPRVRETFIWRKPFHIYKQPIKKQTKIPKPIMLNDSNLIAGTFTRGLEYFKTLKSPIYVKVMYPNYDIEAICYCCAEVGVDCNLVFQKGTVYELNLYGASIVEVEELENFYAENATILSDGCNIPELIEITASKIREEIKSIEETPYTVWGFDSPGINELLLSLFPNADVNIVTCRKVKRSYKEVRFYFSDDNIYKDSSVIPDYPAHKMFDAKTFAFYSKRKDSRDWIWVNK